MNTSKAGICLFMLPILLVVALTPNISKSVHLIWLYCIPDPVAAADRCAALTTLQLLLELFPWQAGCHLSTTSWDEKYRLFRLNARWKDSSDMDVTAALILHFVPAHLDNDKDYANTCGDTESFSRWQMKRESLVDEVR